MAMRYGSRIEEVSFSRAWYETEMPPYIEAFADRTVALPAQEDVLRDHQALQFVDGIIRVPRDFRFKGSDGLDRHGDSAVAGALAWYASNQEAEEFDYQPARGAAPGALDGPEDDDDARDWWRPPLGARLFGRVF
jgi:phage FluMu gp28-like protein